MRRLTPTKTPRSSGPPPSVRLWPETLLIHKDYTCSRCGDAGLGQRRHRGLSISRHRGVPPTWICPPPLQTLLQHVWEGGVPTGQSVEGRGGSGAKLGLWFFFLCGEKKTGVEGRTNQRGMRKRSALFRSRDIFVLLLSVIL
jgi:hypothetical protein